MAAAEIRFTKDHEWIRVEGAEAVVGITDYAQDALGDVVYVQTPTVGSEVKAGDSFGEVESTKSVSDVYAPVSGSVVAVNKALVSNPELLNSDPYGDGWLCEIEMSDAAEVQTLLDADGYETLTAG